MKVVSNAYRKSMEAPLRNRSFAKVVLENVDIDANQDGTWTNSSQVSWSDTSTLDKSYDYGVTTYATLELNRWVLGGMNQIILPDAPLNLGYVSGAVSNEEGVFETPPTLTRQFTAKHDLLGITLTFDTQLEEWPLSVTLTYFDGNTELGSETAGNISGYKSRISLRGNDLNKVVVTFNTALPYHRARLQRVLYGLEAVYQNEELISVTQKHDVDPLSRRLPQETLQFTVLDYEHTYDPDNPQGIYQYIDTGSPVSVQYGYTLDDDTIEWIKPDRYLLKTKPKVANNRVTFEAQGFVGSLTDTFYKSKLGSKTFYDMAIEVLTDANLAPTPQGQNPWEIDELLKNYSTTAALPIKSHMNCLQLIAHACRCRLYTDDDNIIHIKPFYVLAKENYSGTWSDNGHERYSEWNSVVKGNTANSTYATLELNRWDLSGENQIILPDSPNGQGFVSNILSGSTGTYETAPEAEYTFDLSHDLGVVALRFDNILEEYPKQLALKFYNGEMLVSEKVVFPDSAEFTITGALAQDANKMTVSVTQALPYWRWRITKVGYRETDFILNFTTIKEGSQSVSQIDRLKEVTVAKYAYTRNSNSAETLYEETVTDTVLHVEFSSPAENVTISVTGGELLSSTVYARAADLTLSEGSKTVTITGYALNENAQITHYPVSDEGEVDAETNPLITTQAMSDALAEQVKNYLVLRNTYDATYRGNPEVEVGDLIGMQSRYTDEMDAIVLTDEITFNGALSGKLKVKALV